MVVEASLLVGTAEAPCRVAELVEQSAHDPHLTGAAPRVAAVWLAKVGSVSPVAVVLNVSCAAPVLFLPRQGSASLALLSRLAQRPCSSGPALAAGAPF